LNYSEDLNSDFSTFVSEVDSYNLSSTVKSSDNQVLLNIDENQNYDTDATPLVRITSNNSLTDLNSNLIEQFSFIASTDNV
jgi:hypothetical protein